MMMIEAGILRAVFAEAPFMRNVTQLSSGNNAKDFNFMLKVAGGPHVTNRIISFSASLKTFE
jgi:hypothetical protein